MNIWEWVGDTQQTLYEQGYDRLAELIDAVPQAAVDLQHDRVDALVPEALHLAREAGNPWLEVFFRHWNLQSQVFDRNRVADALPEAVALIDFAHREETRDCPQSVCVVQDLSHCYGALDGPGYVQERLAIAGETLARIDASWGCFTCISEEHADALLDDGRYEETLRFLDEQVKALTRAGHRDKRYHMRPQRVEALLRLGRYDEAAKFNGKAKHQWRGESQAFQQRLDTARILAYQGELSQAVEELPDFDEIRATAGHYRCWAETVWLLARHGAIDNDARIDDQFKILSETLLEQGANYNAAVLALWRAELALGRADAAAANGICDYVTEITTRLRRPESIEEQIATLRARSTA